MSSYYDRAPLTPEQIERQGFAIEHRGYQRDQVRAFLYDVAESLRTALQSNRSPVAGPPPAWPRPNEPGLGELGFDNTRILRAHLSASLRQEAELDQDAEAILEQARAEATATVARAEADAATILARAQTEADELLAEAEAEADRQRDRARRALVSAQEEAAAVVGDAEARAKRILAGVRQDALNHHQQVSTVLESRTEQLVAAEQGTLHRLSEARRALSKLIEDLAGAEPVVGPSIEILRLAVDARTTGEPSMAAAPPAVTEVTPPAEHPDDHPVARMVRAAVGRAMDAAITLPDDEDEDELSLDLDGDVVDDGPAPLAMPAVALPAAPAAHGPSGGGADLRDLLSELADIVAEDDDPGLPPDHFG